MATKLEDIVISPGLTGFYYDDKAAIKAGARRDGFTYLGKPVTPGFSAIRQPGEALSVMLILDDGQVAIGDCVSVQHAGSGGRDPVFLAQTCGRTVSMKLAPLMRGLKVERFRETAEWIDSQTGENGRRLHTALRYGLSQAWLAAVAKARRITMTEVLCGEYNLPVPREPVPLFCQSGDDRYINADKMIIKRAGVLPHGLINNRDEKLGRWGEKLFDYVGWLRDRVQTLADDNYRPTFHIDVYGTLGEAFDNDVARIADYLGRLESQARPYGLSIEDPVDCENKQTQLETMILLREHLKDKGIGVKIVADEWCNTLEDIRTFTDCGAADLIQVKTPDLGGVQNSVEAVLYCRQKGTGAYLGGSSNETDVSARVCTHVALATRPAFMLAKPGMGVDEGMATVYNEMQRTLAILAWREKRQAGGGLRDDVRKPG